jgi:hypothetical protein
MRDNLTHPPAGHPTDFPTLFLKARLAFDATVQEFLQGEWDESTRAIVQTMAAALRRAAGHAGWWETENILRAIEGLLALSPHDVLPVRRAVGEKLVELLGSLNKLPMSRTA